MADHCSPLDIYINTNSGTVAMFSRDHLDGPNGTLMFINNMLGQCGEESNNIQLH